MEVGDNWGWVAQGVERQPVAAAAALGGVEDAPDVDEGAQAVPTPVHAPPPPPPAAGRTMHQRLGRLEEENKLGRPQDFQVYDNATDANITECNYVSYAHMITEARTLIMEYLVKISKKARILKLKRRHFKDYCSEHNTPYHQRKIRRILHAFTEVPQRIKISNVGNPWDQRVRSQLIGKDLISGLLVYELPNSSYLGLKKKYRLSLKNDMPPRDK
ncbi:hypothetical protein Tco_0946302 [Tanacetum coccineum]